MDAISLDVLMKSRFTINIFGYCGSSSIQEFAGGNLNKLLPSLGPIDKLRMATWMANGIADIHAVDALESSSKLGIADNSTNVTASLIHNDINMDNVLLGHRNGMELPIFNDFNIAVFRKKDAQGRPCRFHGRFANPIVSCCVCQCMHHSISLLAVQLTRRSLLLTCGSGCLPSNREGPMIHYQLVTWMKKSMSTHLETYCTKSLLARARGR